MTTEATETLLDRDAELEALRRTLADAREGRGRLVIVEGEPGIGKTALLGRARGAASDAGFTVLSAAGADLEREFAWGVARQLFEPLVYGARGPRRATGPEGPARTAGRRQSAQPERIRDPIVRAPATETAASARSASDAAASRARTSRSRYSADGKLMREVSP